MITKEAMCEFMETAREQKKLSWDETAKLAFIHLHFGHLDRPYSGAGFRHAVIQYTGRKVWGPTRLRRKPEPTNNPWWEEVETSNLSPEVKKCVMNICSLIYPPHKITKINT